MKTKSCICGVRHPLDGGTATVSNETSISPRRTAWRWNFARRLKGAVRAIALWSILTCAVDAANPPPVSLFHISTGPIPGGVTVGEDGVVYFSTLTNGAIKAKVTALYPNGTVKWTFEPLVGGFSSNMWCMPILEPEDNTLLIGSDAGVFYGVDAATGVENWNYSVSAPAGTDKRIRSTAAFNYIGLTQPNVYFHCNDGYLYAFKARNGTFKWKKATGNNGGPPPSNPDHLEPWSSSPVIGADGTVYVGSADGKVYAFNPITGANKWPSPVVLKATPTDPAAPIEATIAIAADGWLYAATRQANPLPGGRLFAINPAKAVVDPSQAIEWWVDVPSLGQPGIIASPVIDQSGFVYVADFHDNLLKYHPKAAPPPAPPQTAVELRHWNIYAKFCQTPSLTQDGLLIVGTSADHNLDQVKRAIRAFHTDKPDSPFWTVPQVNGQDVGDFFGSPAIICSDAGTTYIADLDMLTGAGRLYRFDSGSTLMAGDWPTFQSGNRRLGKVKTYSYSIMELPPFPDGYAGTQLGHLDPYGRAVGTAHGTLPCSSDPDVYWPALWRNAVPTTPGACDPTVGTWFARAINGFGDVAGYFNNSPIVWPNGVYDSTVFSVALPTPNPTPAYALDINTSGAIVGYTTSGSAISVLLWVKSGGAWGVQSVPGPGPTQDYPAYGYAISDAGHIAGKARFTSPTSAWHAYVTPENPTVISGDLGTFGGLESEAWDVNDESGTVGWAQNGSALHRAFYIQIGGVSLQSVNELPRLAGTTGTSYNSEAYGVNRLGQVVGKIQNDSGAYRAFWWKTPGPGTFLTDLTMMLLDGGQTPQSLGWTLLSAVAINDGGVIIGYGTQSGTQKAWILYPKCQE